MVKRRTTNNRYDVQYIDEDETGDIVGSYHVIYDVTPYYPETRPTYACAGEPASGPDIEIVDITPEPPLGLYPVIKQWLEENHDFSEDY